MDNELLDEKQAAQRLGLTRRCMQCWRNAGRGPQFVRISARCVRYRPTDIERFIEGRVVQSTSAPLPDEGNPA